MTAQEAFDHVVDDIDQHCQCINGTTAHGNWLLWRAKEALDQVGAGATWGGFMSAFDALTEE